MLISALACAYNAASQCGHNNNLPLTGRNLVPMIGAGLFLVALGFGPMVRDKLAERRTRA